MGRIVDGLKEVIKIQTGLTVEGNTKGEVLQDFISKSKPIPLTIKISDGTSDILGSVVTLKEGSAIGSGSAISASSDGTYSVKYGTYNYEVSKAGYTSTSGTIDITMDDCLAKGKTVTVVLTEST